MLTALHLCIMDQPLAFSACPSDMSCDTHLGFPLNCPVGSWTRWNNCSFLPSCLLRSLIGQPHMGPEAPLSPSVQLPTLRLGNTIPRYLRLQFRCERSKNTASPVIARSSEKLRVVVDQHHPQLLLTWLLPFEMRAYASTTAAVSCRRNPNSSFPEIAQLWLRGVPMCCILGHGERMFPLDRGC